MHTTVHDLRTSTEYHAHTHTFEEKRHEVAVAVDDIAGNGVAPAPLGLRKDDPARRAHSPPAVVVPI